MSPLKTITGAIDKVRTWIRERRVLKALPTLEALCAGGPYYYGRSVDRLWLDGGSVKGFDACVKLGWAEYRDRSIGEPMGRPTGEGITEARIRGFIPVDA